MLPKPLMIPFMVKKLSTKQSNECTALQTKTRSFHPPSLKSKVLPPTWMPSPPSHGTGSSSRNVSMRRCPLCENSHDLDDCNGYKRKSVEERRSFLADKALCLACYGKNQQSKCCTRKRTCKKCKKLHPTLLHMDGFFLPKENGTVGQEMTGNDKPLKVNNACVDIPQESNNESNILFFFLKQTKIFIGALTLLTILRQLQILIHFLQSQCANISVQLITYNYYKTNNTSKHTVLYIYPKGNRRLQKK